MQVTSTTPGASRCYVLLLLSPGELSITWRPTALHISSCTSCDLFPTSNRGSRRRLIQTRGTAAPPPPAPPQAPAARLEQQQPARPPGAPPASPQPANKQSTHGGQLAGRRMRRRRQAYAPAWSSPASAAYAMIFHEQAAPSAQQENEMTTDVSTERFAYVSQSLTRTGEAQELTRSANEARNVFKFGEKPRSEGPASGSAVRLSSVVCTCSQPEPGSTALLQPPPHASSEPLWCSQAPPRSKVGRQDPHRHTQRHRQEPVRVAVLPRLRR